MFVLECYILEVGEYKTAWIHYGRNSTINCVSMGETTLSIHEDIALYTLVAFEFTV